MSAAPDKVCMGTLAAGDAERLRTRLAREGIEIRTIHNGASCNSGCSIQLEIWAHPDDLTEIGQLIELDRRRALADLGADLARTDAVFDTSQPTAECPACGTAFSTTAQACPDCGLEFQVPNNVE
jgi:hypothetical protein